MFLRIQQRRLIVGKYKNDIWQPIIVAATQAFYRSFEGGRLSSREICFCLCQYIVSYRAFGDEKEREQKFDKLHLQPEI